MEKRLKRQKIENLNNWNKKIEENHEHTINLLIINSFIMLFLGLLTPYIMEIYLGFEQIIIDKLTPIQYVFYSLAFISFMSYGFQWWKNSQEEKKVKTIQSSLSQ